MPKFSIVIPAYNSAPYIDETLASLAKQTFKDFEAIIIDDHSKDDTVAVAQQAMAKYQLAGIVLKRPDDVEKGVANCRNLGIKTASGEWVCFLDSDDLFLPHKLQGTAALIDKYAPACKAYFHASRDFEDGTGKTLTIREREPFAAPRDLLPELIHLNYITTSSVTINRALLVEIGGFNNRLHGIEDYMLWLRVSKRTLWYYSHEQWTDYRVRTTSLMGGRAMDYYVTQNHNLVLTAKDYNEFTQEEIAAIEYYLFNNVMNYYAQQSLNHKGTGDFLKGIVALTKVNRGNLAARLLAKETKLALLRQVSKLKKK
ncbi:MAG: glycosyltransferase family 2 protein [Chitinophagia bacterium]|nr:glycosyltransferase family 2 protein [Chitinophagia bacterium]